MENELDTSLHIAIELILCALIIGAVGICCTVGFKAYYNKVNTDSINAVTAEKAELFYYDNKVVSGSDALELILKNTRNYSYWFEKYAGGNLVESLEISTDLESVAPADYDGTWSYTVYWSEMNIRKLLSNKTRNKYQSVIVYDDSGNSIMGLKFIES